MAVGPPTRYGPPAAYESVDVNLVEAGRVERHPACLFEVEIPERRAFGVVNWITR